MKITQAASLGAALVAAAFAAAPFADATAAAVPAAVHVAAASTFNVSNVFGSHMVRSGHSAWGSRGWRHGAPRDAGGEVRGPATHLHASTSNASARRAGTQLQVLQRDRPVIVYGGAAPGVTVKTVFAGDTYGPVAADANGTWRQTLPATAAGGPYVLTFSSSDGGAATLDDVLFGDVHLCGGQSNMQFTLLSNAGVPNATAEIAAANAYPAIRVFTVGQGTTSTTPLAQLGSIEQGWALAANTSIGLGGWTAFSAVCWFTYRDIFNALGGTVPQGLVSNNWGGTPYVAAAAALLPCASTHTHTHIHAFTPQPATHVLDAVCSIQHWSSPAALAQCDGGVDSTLWNAMINPYVVGPFSFRTAIWYQGNVVPLSCAFVCVCVCVCVFHCATPTGTRRSLCLGAVLQARLTWGKRHTMTANSLP